MDSSQPAWASIDAYITAQPETWQPRLRQIRQIIAQTAPQAVEKISYQMPTFFYKRNLIHFALFKQHIGLYPGAEAVAVFGPELTAYQTSKGAIQLPLDQPLPTDLIVRLVQFRVEAEDRRTANR